MGGKGFGLMVQENNIWQKQEWQRTETSILLSVGSANLLLEGTGREVVNLRLEI